MSKTVIIPVTCLECNTVRDCTVYSSINVTINPELKNDFLENKINIFKCEKCGNTAAIPFSFMYHDMDNKFQVIFSEDEIGEEWQGGIRLAQQHFGNDHYAANPLIVHNRLEAVFMVAVCDENGSPETKERRAAYHETVKALVESAVSKHKSAE